MVSNAQQNLVPNPSFEEFATCPHQRSELYYCNSWQMVYASPDYYNSCDTIGEVGIPQSFGGWQNAHSGNGYAGIALLGKDKGPIWYNLTEMFACHIPALKQGHKYNTNFFVSLMDSDWFACKNIGIYFSKNIYPESNPSSPNYCKKLIPQVRYTGTSFLNDKENWVPISGSFIADGGETLMIIGNFDDDSLAQVEYVGGPAHGPNSVDDTLYWRESYYYIDDVSLIEDTTYKPNGLEEEQLKLVKVGYANGCVNLSGILFQQQASNLTVSTLEGKEVFSKAIQAGNNQQSIPLPNLPPNVYLYSIGVNGGVVKRGKLLVGE
jgi:hypothetical protein